MNIASILQSRPVVKEKKPKITNERQLILKDFLDRLNAGRVASGYKLLQPARLGVMMRHMTTSEMKVFYGECNYAKNFSSYFWYKMNPKNYE